MKDKNTQENQVIDTLKTQTMSILLDAQEHLQHLAKRQTADIYGSR